jgi:hypothetical protein
VFSSFFAEKEKLVGDREKGVHPRFHTMNKLGQLLRRGLHTSAAARGGGHGGHGSYVSWHCAQIPQLVRVKSRM